MHPVVTEEAIKEAEFVLFGRPNVFDSERINFIKNLETLDLQAIPGSGKTTVLLAKLVILSTHQPFPDESGILVLSHTNAAVDQINSKIGAHSPSLFSYPNFVGTIQSFVDLFLAIPCFEHIFGFRPDFIDAEAYRGRIEKRFKTFAAPPGYSRQESNNARSYLIANQEKHIDYSYRFALNDAGETILTDGLNGKELSFAKPRRSRQRNYVDFTPQEKQRIRKWLSDFKFLLWAKERVIHYDDAYYLAQRYLLSFPRISTILKKRFRYVFVDEMQDMDTHQVDILDRIFYQNIETNQTFQRIGDKNQAIFSYDVKLENVWQDRPNIMTLGRSLRLSTVVANVVKPFGLLPVDIEGSNRQSNLKRIRPRIILYDDRSITQIIARFAEIIRELKDSNDLPSGKDDVYKAVGWRRFSDENRKTTLKNYFPAFNSEKRKMPVECLCFEDFLTCSDLTRFSSKLFYDILSNAITRILSLEKITDHNIDFSKSRLNTYLKIADENLYLEYKSVIFHITQEHIRENLAEVKRLITELMTKLVTHFKNNGTPLPETLDFINKRSAIIPIDTEVQKAENKFKQDGIEIEIGTVHSAKGQTHTGTLYLETFYKSDRGKSFESERLIEQLKGTQIGPTAGVNTKQSARVVYVGFSRPTHLLCFAAHRDRIRGHEQDLEQNGWLIDRKLVN